MAKVHQIVKYINDSLMEGVFSDKRFSGSGVYGIATQVPRAIDSEGHYDIVMPIIDESGNTVLDDAFYNQNEPMRIFHRIISSGYSPDQPASFGSNMESKRTIGMGMVIFADKKRVQINAEDLDLMAHIEMPRIVPKSMMQAGYGQMSISHQQTELNQVILFGQLFRKYDFTLEPQVVLLELKYSIEYTATAACIKSLCCN